jgi:trans-aconitate methyltransferase
MRAFTTSAEYYEVLSDNESRLANEGPFLLKLLRESPGIRIVDMACGTGIHAEFFASHGARVEAFDISREMITHAEKSRPHPLITFRTGDMRALSGGPWDLAVCLGNSLSLLTTSEDLAATFRAVRSSLAPGGRFCFQILNYLAGSSQEPRHRIVHRTAGNTEVTAVKNLVPHKGITYLSLAFYSRSGEECTSLSETAVLKNWTENDVVKALGEAGFTIQGIYGGFDSSAYSPEQSPDIVCVALRES